MVRIDTEELLTVSQAADERGTTRQAINYLIRQGKLATVEIAGRRFVSRRELSTFTPDRGGRPPKQGKAATSGMHAGNGQPARASKQAGKKRGKR